MATFADLLAPIPDAVNGRTGAGALVNKFASTFLGVRDFLGGHLCRIDLQILDRGFAVEKLQTGLANGVTFFLPEGRELTRLAMVRRLSANREAYRRCYIWPAVTNTSTTPEIDARLAQRMPFVTGRAATVSLDHPLAGGIRATAPPARDAHA